MNKIKPLFPRPTVVKLFNTYVQLIDNHDLLVNGCGNRAEF